MYCSTPPKLWEMPFNLGLAECWCAGEFCPEFREDDVSKEGCCGVELRDPVELNKLPELDMSSIAIMSAAGFKGPGLFGTVPPIGAEPDM